MGDADAAEAEEGLRRQEKRRAVFEHAVPELAGGGPVSLARALADPDAVKARLADAMAMTFGAGAAIADRS